MAGGDAARPRCGRAKALLRQPHGRVTAALLSEAVARTQSLAGVARSRGRALAVVAFPTSHPHPTPTPRPWRPTPRPWRSRLLARDVCQGTSDSDPLPLPLKLNEHAGQSPDKMTMAPGPAGDSDSNVTSLQLLYTGTTHVHWVQGSFSLTGRLILAGRSAGSFSSAGRLSDSDCISGCSFNPFKKERAC